MTTKVGSGLPDDTVEVKLDTDDDEYLDSKPCIDISLPLGYDSKITPMFDHSIQDVRVIRRNTSVGISRGRTVKQPYYAVIDPGAAEDLVGGLGWQVTFISRRTETVAGALNGMGTITLPKVDAITAVVDDKNNVHLLGFGNVSFDSRISQHESLLNSHHLRDNGCVINDVAKKHGGKQNMEIKVDNQLTKIPFSFDGDIMMLKLREPTEEELTTLGVVWITPAIEKHSSQSI